MAEIKQQYVFSYKEVVEALIQKQGLHEGIWGIYVEFGIAGTNIQNPSDPEDMKPAAIVPVVKLGLQRFEKINPISVDAAVVNPAKKKQTRR